MTYERHDRDQGHELRDTRCPRRWGRWSLILGAIMLVAPGTAGAATVAREGDAVVFRSAPGERAQVGGGADTGAGVIAISTSQFPDSPVVPGAGCAFAPEEPPRVGINPYKVLCPLAGVRLVHIITADRDDIIDAGGSGVPVLVEAGGGNDKIMAQAESSNVAVLAGAGNDKLQARDGAGDLRMDGEAGDDELLTVPELPQPGGIVLSGGPGDDYIYSHNDATLSGGDGDDRLTHSVNDPGTPARPRSHAARELTFMNLRRAIVSARAARRFCPRAASSSVTRRPASRLPSAVGGPRLRHRSGCKSSPGGAAP